MNNNKKIAIYAGSFDPITNGHLWVINQSYQIFDKLIIAVGVNPTKKNTGMFSVQERIEIINESLKNISINCQVVNMENNYLSKFAEKVSAKYIVRGVRNYVDFEIEQTMSRINTKMNKDVTTIFLTPPEDLASISSSFVKGLIGYNEWKKEIQKYVPSYCFKKILNKYEEKTNEI